MGNIVNRAAVYIAIKTAIRNICTPTREIPKSTMLESKLLVSFTQNKYPSFTLHFLKGEEGNPKAMRYLLFYVSNLRLAEVIAGPHFS